MTGWMTASQVGRAARPEIGELLQGDAEFEEDWLPGPLGQHPVGGQHPHHHFFQRVVQPLLGGAGVFGAARPGQRAEHRLGRRGAPLGQVTVQPARAAEGPGQPQPPVIEPVAGAGVGPGVLTGQVLRDAGQVGQARPRRYGGEQFTVGVVTHLVGQGLGP